jgi:hypothetical protein
MIIWKDSLFAGKCKKVKFGLNLGALKQDGDWCGFSGFGLSFFKISVCVSFGFCAGFVRRASGSAARIEEKGVRFGSRLVAC